MPLVGLYKFNEGSNTIIDYSGEGNDITDPDLGVIRNLVWQTGYNGYANAIDFQDITNQGSFFNNLTIDYGFSDNNMSLAWWWNIRSIGTGAILRFSTGLHITSYDLRTAIDGSNFPSDVAGAIGEWHHIGFVNNETAGTLQWYVDGLPAGTYGDIGGIDNTILIRVGKYSEVGTSFKYAGWVNDLHIWNEAVDQSTIQQARDRAFYPAIEVIGNHEPIYIHGGTLAAIIEIRGNHQPIYTHGGIIEEVEVEPTIPELIGIDTICTNSEALCALMDIEEVAMLYGKEMTVFLNTEQEVIRDRYGQIIKVPNTLKTLIVYSYPLDLTPNQYQLNKAGIKEEVDALAYTPYITWIKEGVGFNDIKFENTEINIDGDTYIIKDKNQASQFADIYLYIVLGLVVK